MDLAASLIGIKFRLRNLGGPLRVNDGCGLQADGTAGVPSAPEIAGAFRNLRSVPTAEEGCLTSRRGAMETVVRFDLVF
jgi:hypothetical protein